MDIYLFSIVLLICIFLYIAFTVSPPYSNDKVANRLWKSDYSIFLSSTLILILCIYIELQYKVFANKIGYEVLFVSILFLIFAYYFDHLIILSISLTGLATSIELIVNPNDLLNPIAFDKSETMLSILFGVSLVLAAQTLDQKYIKQHFTLHILMLQPIYYFYIVS